MIDSFTSLGIAARQTVQRVLLFALLIPSLQGVAVAQEDEAIPQRLTVATRQVPPFAMLDENGQWVGISIELLREVKASLESESDQAIELDIREMNLTEMLDAAEKGEIDLAAAALTVNYDRETRMDFTHPFHNTGLGIAVAGKQGSTWDGVISAIFSLTFIRLMVGLFAVLLISGLAVYLFERKRNPNFSGGVTRGVSSGIWWAAVTMTTVGYGDKVPQTAGGRFIGCIWMFSGLFLIASFTAAVTSALTVNQLTSRIAGPDDLSRVRVATVEDSTSDNYLRSRHIFSRKFPDVRSALESLEAGNVDAVVYDATILQYEAHQTFDDELFVLPITFQRQDYAFAFPSDSTLREPINQVLLREIGSPEWEEVLSGYLGDWHEQ